MARYLKRAAVLLAAMSLTLVCGLHVVGESAARTGKDA